MYLTLHPEDKEVKEEELEIITLENILTTAVYLRAMNFTARSGDVG